MGWGLWWHHMGQRGAGTQGDLLYQPMGTRCGALQPHGDMVGSPPTHGDTFGSCTTPWGRAGHLCHPVGTGWTPLRPLWDTLCCFTTPWGHIGLLYHPMGTRCRALQPHGDGVGSGTTPCGPAGPIWVALERHWDTAAGSRGAGWGVPPAGTYSPHTSPFRWGSRHPPALPTRSGGMGGAPHRGVSPAPGGAAGLTRLGPQPRCIHGSGSTSRLRGGDSRTFPGTNWNIVSGRADRSATPRPTRSKLAATEIAGAAAQGPALRAVSPHQRGRTDGAGRNGAGRGGCAAAAPLLHPTGPGGRGGIGGGGGNREGMRGR